MHLKRLIDFRGEVFSSSRYGQGSGRIWLDDVACDGSEVTIQSCNHAGWGVENCDHSEDVGIKCTRK